MARFDYWVHGVSTFVEDEGAGFRVTRQGGGTTVQQTANTDSTANTANWLHLAVPTPTIIDDEEKVGLQIMAFHAETNENARITDWHVWMNGNQVAQRTLRLTGASIYQDWRIPNWSVTGGLVLCLRAEFLPGDPIGTVTIKGAGAGFEG